MHWIDYVIIFLYIAFAIGVGLYFSGKASKNSESFFLGGRSLPWWAICLSMIATSFASDTPIWVTEVTRKDGLERMWWVIVSVLPLIVFSMLIGVGIHMLNGVNIAWVYAAYMLGGVAMGMFETNLLNSTLDLGHGTKTWSILGMPGEPARLPRYARPDSALTPPGPGARSRLRLDVCGRLPRPGSADQPTR